MRLLNTTLVGLGLVLGLVLMTPATAQADKASKKIKAKTSQAMDEYDMMEFESAKTLLIEAIAVGERANAEGPALAAAYLNLGIVYFSGLSEEAEASEAFANAVRIDASVKLDVAYSTPEMKDLLDLARQQGSGGEEAGNCDGAGIDHELVDEAARGSAPEIRASLASDVKASQMYVFFRSEGQLEFSKAKMKKSGSCSYVASIPTRAVQGEFVHYYVAAVNKSGKEIERKGSRGSPNIIEVAAAVGGTVSMTDEDPLNPDKPGSILDDEKDSGSLFVSVAIGSGSGLISGPTEKTKSRVDTDASPFAPAYLHIMPEVGYFLNNQMSVAAAFRMGLPVDASVEGHATFAPAGLLRFRYLLKPTGEGLQLSGSIGGGIIRNTVQIDDAMSENNTDTTAMGPLLFGAGVGYVKSLGGPLRLVAEVQALAALTAGFDELGSCPGDGCVNPTNGAQFDAALGLLFAF